MRDLKLLTQLSLAALATGLVGCAVGPNFTRPPPPGVASYTPPSAALPSRLGPQTLTPGGAVAGDWWRAFHSPQLDALVAEALKNNSDLAAAEAALKAAHETYLSQVSVLLPTVDASAASTRNKSSQYLSPPLNAESFYYTLQTAQLNFNYTLDIFGGARRQVEAAKAQERAQKFQTDNARVALVTNVVVAAVQEASLREQVNAQESVIKLETDILDVMRRQLALGQIGRSDLLLQEAALAQVQAGLPPLQKLQSAQADLVSYLIGETPGQGNLQWVDLDHLTLPADIPVGLPSKLVEHRSDVRVAEENLHVASANVGVAVAARLPSLTLTANAGGAGNTWSKVLSHSDTFWSYGAGLTQPLFEGGALYHKEKSAKASLVQAQELYKSAVLTAFQNVSDALQALTIDSRALDFAAAAQTAAAASLAISRRQAAEGQVAGFTVLSAEQTLRLADLALVQARAARFTDTASLFQALGGGWDGKTIPNAS